MFGGVPIIGGIESALMGQNNYRARAPSTAAGKEAIRQQMALAGRRAQAAQHSSIASARGPTAGLMAREGMRRGAMAQQSAMEQTGILQKQLEQNALDQQMRAQEINAQIAGQNAQGMQRLVGTAVGALGGAALMSDERTKNPIGDKYAGATGGPDDGRRVIWGQQSPMAMERDKVAADAKAAGVQLSPSDYAAMGYAPPGGQADVVAPRPVAPAPAPAPAAPPPSFGQRFGGQLAQGFLQLSDKRAKELESENGVLRRALLAGPQATPVPEPPPATPVPEPPPNRVVRSDEESKRGGSVNLEFPEGVEPKAFTYKPEFSDGDPGVHYGVMAQDLEKSKEGASVVSEDPATGLKQVDPDRLTMLNTAALSDLERRLRRLEGHG